ncbi:hypothetical protein HK104_010181 [Borealophlyctis nickersoniae]|nr:hypothetical protein HK104_010181 [Borealophlyctis nickersoniae]
MSIKGIEEGGRLIVEYSVLKWMELKPYLIVQAMRDSLAERETSSTRDTTWNFHESLLKRLGEQPPIAEDTFVPNRSLLEAAVKNHEWTPETYVEIVIGAKDVTVRQVYPYMNRHIDDPRYAGHRWKIVTTVDGFIESVSERDGAKEGTDAKQLEDLIKAIDREADAELEDRWRNFIEAEIENLANEGRLILNAVLSKQLESVRRAISREREWQDWRKKRSARESHPPPTKRDFDLRYEMDWLRTSLNVIATTRRDWIVPWRSGRTDKN